MAIPSTYTYRENLQGGVGNFEMLDVQLNSKAMFTLTELNGLITTALYKQLELNSNYAKYEPLVSDVITRVTGYKVADLNASASLKLSLKQPFAWLIEKYSQPLLASEKSENYMREVADNYKLAMAQIHTIVKMDTEDVSNSDQHIGNHPINNLPRW